MSETTKIMLPITTDDLAAIADSFSPERSTQKTLKECSAYIWHCYKYCMIFNSDKRGQHCGVLDNGIEVYCDPDDNQDMDSYRTVDGINFFDWLKK